MASPSHVLPFSWETPTIPLPDPIKRVAAANYGSYFTILDPVSVVDLNENERNNIQGILLTGGTNGKSKLDREIMDLFPNLRVISTPSVGTNHIDVETASARGIRVGHAPGSITGAAVADLAFSLLLGSARNIVQGDRIAKSPEVTTDHEMRDLLGSSGEDVTGATIGIIGLGSIGTAVAERARAFRMTILYHSRTQKEEQEKNFGIKFCPSLKELLCESDFVVLCVPFTAQTKDLISSKELNQMKSSATLINVARGACVNHDDLTAALQNGVIRAAALDVTEPAPLPRNHPLLKMSNVIILPHTGYFTKNTEKNIWLSSFDNLKAVFQGYQMPYPSN